MIYVFSGNDNKSKNLEIKKVSTNKEVFFLSQRDFIKEKIFEYTNIQNLFGEYPCVVLEGFFDEKNSLLKKEILELKESKTIFIFKEDNFTITNLKKYEDFILFKKFEEKNIKKSEVNISFEIGNAFGSRDKMKTWVLYNQAVKRGIDGEQIVGILFWKIKNLLTSNQSFFSKEELKKSSKLLISLYHDAHLGKKDLVVGLEQYLLSVLSK